MNDDDFFDRILYNIKIYVNFGATQSGKDWGVPV